MSGTTKRMYAGVGGIALVMALAGTAFFTAQHVNAQGPGGFGGPGGRFGAPGGPGGPGGPGRGGRGEPGGPMGPGGGVLGPMMIERLDLSQDQRDRVQQILDSHRAEQQVLGDRGMAARDGLEAALSAGTFDESVIRARAADVAAVDADQTVARARIYAEVFQILTSDQQTKLKAMQAEMHEREARMRAAREQKQEQKP